MTETRPHNTINCIRCDTYTQGLLTLPETLNPEGYPPTFWVCAACTEKLRRRIAAFFSLEDSGYWGNR